MNQLAKRIYDISHLTGSFLLRSGKTSDEYFDKYLFEGNPRILKEIAVQLAVSIPDSIDVLAGLEMGGIPIATALSLEMNIPAAFVRKKAKEYGTCKIAEGADIAGKRVCVIEDVVTTGGQILLSTEDLRNAGAIVEEVRCVILCDELGREKLREQGLNLHSLFTMQELLDASGLGEGQ